MNKLNNVNVSNMRSSKGNSIANQFDMNIEGTKYFVSYTSTIAQLHNGILTLGHNWDYSRTTMKYLYIWLKDNCSQLMSDLPRKASMKATMQNAIDTGIIQYDGGRE